MQVEEARWAPLRQLVKKKSSCTIKKRNDFLHRRKEKWASNQDEIARLKKRKANEEEATLEAMRKRKYSLKNEIARGVITGYLKDGHAMCDILVRLKLLNKQRLMKHCVLPIRAWSQNGHVMCANPVHLKHLRKQRLVRKTVLCPPPRAETAN
jgi:uncharacterized protein YdcH (DUF465 family)